MHRRNGFRFVRRRLKTRDAVERCLEWTGEALYDVAGARMKACAMPNKKPELRTLFSDAITDRRLIDAFRTLRVPRHLFKFLYRLLVSHCNAFTDANPVWQISGELFESTFALYSRDQDAFDRGLKTV